MARIEEHRTTYSQGYYSSKFFLHPLSTMWAAINEDNEECTLFNEERDALLYVCLKLLSYSRHSYPGKFPVHPRKMDTAALSAAVDDQRGNDKYWFVTQTSMGELDEVKGEDEEDEVKEEGEEGVVKEEGDE
jgi:hypothetical protein